MSKAGKILVGLTAVFALFMFCMALLGGVLLFITSDSSSSTVDARNEEFNGGSVNENTTSSTSTSESDKNTVTFDTTGEVGFALARILSEVVKLVALIAIMGGAGIIKINGR